MPRRRAVRLVGAAVVAMAVPGLRPRTAFADSPCGGGTSKCGPDTPCSSLCSPPFVKGACGLPDCNTCNLGGRGQERCHVGFAGCMKPGQVCCKTGPDPWLCEKGERCGAKASECIKACQPRYQCGESCCKTNEYCEKHFIGADYCDKICPTGHDKCNGICCTADESCGFFGCSCNSGLVSTGAGTCVPPREDPGDPKPGWNPFRDMWNMMGQSGTAHPSGRRRIAFSSTTAVDAALGALAAVNGQGAAAMLAIREGKRDPAYAQPVRVARATPPKLSGDAVLDAGSAAALNKLLVAEADAYALIAAMAKALWRARAAHAKQNSAAARSQLRASAHFSQQAVTALKRVRALRPATARALTAGQVPEVIATDAAVTTFIASVKSHGIPASLRAPMRKLGVDSAGLDRVRTGVLDQPSAAATGAILIAPLQDRTRAKDLDGLITELSKFSTRARKHPIAR